MIKVTCREQPNRQTNELNICLAMKTWLSGHYPYLESTDWHPIEACFSLDLYFLHLHFKKKGSIPHSTYESSESYQKRSSPNLNARSPPKSVKRIKYSPTLVASCTLRSCSFWVGLPFRQWERATAAHQLDRGSGLNRNSESKKRY